MWDASLARRYGSKTCSCNSNVPDTVECKSCTSMAVRVRKSMVRAEAALMACLTCEIRCDSTDSHGLSRLLRREVCQATEGVRDMIRDQLRMVCYRYVTAENQDAADAVVDAEMDAAMCGHPPVLMDVRMAARSMFRRDQLDEDVSADESNRRRYEVARLMRIKMNADRDGKLYAKISPCLGDRNTSRQTHVHACCPSCSGFRSPAYYVRKPRASPCICQQQPAQPAGGCPHAFGAQR